MLLAAGRTVISRADSFCRATEKTAKQSDVPPSVILNAQSSDLTDDAKVGESDHRSDPDLVGDTNADLGGKQDIPDANRAAGETGAWK